MEVKQLEQIVENTRRKIGYQILVSGSDSKIVTTFEQPIKLDPSKQYELALLNLETYYSFPNIDETNNSLRYRKGEKGIWQTLTIPKGCYEIKAINTTIQRLIGDQGITVLPNLNTLRCMLCLKDSYQVDFKEANSIRTVLGFNAEVYKTPGPHSGEHSVNILRINSILVHTDIISNTYQDGRMEPIIYSFFPNVSPGEKIVAIQKNLIYSSVTTDTIYRMTTWLTDQDSNALDLQGETVTVRFHLREC